MSVKAVANKVVFVLGALFVFLLICEGGLRLSGRFALAKDGVSDEESRKLSEAGVVCIGNLYTPGVGARPGESYCNYIQELGTERGLNLSAQDWVVPLHNTSEILSDLHIKMNHSKPKIALVMAGETNLINFKGFAEYQKRRDSPRDQREQPPSLLEQSALFSLYRLLSNQFEETQDFNANGWPFQPIDPKNELEVAYRWLSWARSNYPERGVNDAQASEILRGMKLIKDADPENIAADLVASEIQAIHFHNPDKALNLLKGIPSSHEACLAFLEAPALDRLSTGLPTILQRKVKGASAGDYVQMLASARSILQSKLNNEEKTFVEKIMKRRTTPNYDLFSPATPNLLDQSKKMRSLFEVLTDCGSYHDTTYVFLAPVYMRSNNQEAVFSTSFRQAKYFPFSPYSESWQWLNASLMFFKNPVQAEQRIETLKKSRAQILGDLAGENAVIPQAMLAEWTEFELKEIAKYLEESGTKVIFMTYPPVPFRGLHPVKKTPIIDLPPYDVDKQVRKVSEETKGRLFDTYNRLRERFKDKKELREFYAFRFGKMDPHLNSAGYKVLAEELLNYLEKENLTSQFRK